jgi:hypothetical protein
MPVENVPDALFSSDNEYGIPGLSMQWPGDFVDAPVHGWGSVSRRSRMGGTWHFYVDDYKFAAIWKKPDELLKTKAVSIVEVNFTTSDQMPMAECIYRTYQKRWLSRYWQQYGIRVFVDLNVPEKCDQLNLYGVPYGWKSYATSAADNNIEVFLRQVNCASKRAFDEPLNMLVYGGGPEIKQICDQNNWLNIPDARNASRETKHA